MSKKPGRYLILEGEDTYGVTVFLVVDSAIDYVVGVFDSIPEAERYTYVRMDQDALYTGG